MNSELIYPIIYLAVGIGFGELSLMVQQATVEENQPSVKALTYIFAVFTWPLIILMALLKSGGKS